MALEKSTLEKLQKQEKGFGESSLWLKKFWAIHFVEVVVGGMNMTDFQFYKQFRSELDEMCIPTILKQCQHIIKITDDKTEIGILCVNNGYIDCLYVLPEFRQQGYGRKAVISFIEKYGIPKSLHIIDTNTVAKSFWESIFDISAVVGNGIDTFYKINGLKEIPKKDVIKNGTI